MLENTFIHVPGIGALTERRLWQRGLITWDQALAETDPPGGFGAERWALVRDHLLSSQRSLEARDHAYFSHHLAARDHWRALEPFRSRAAYVDIETTGRYGSDAITVIGLYDGRRVHTFVKGENLGDFAEAIQEFALLVTFNGATFDLPFLRRAFRHVAWDHLHVDLRFALAALGHHGGLKRIEKDLGLCREAEIDGLCGEDAVRLWQEHRRGSSQALETLIAYNAADVENLEALLDIAYPRLIARTECPVTP